MRDVEKTSIGTERNVRRARRRRRGFSLYVLMGMLIAVASVVTLSMTVFFNIRTIEVMGVADSYTAEEIVAASGINVGDNMLRLNLPQHEKAALEKLIKVETLDIRRKFPNTLVIEVHKCTPAYNVSYEHGTLIVSEQGKIISNEMEPQADLIDIIGYVPRENTPGKLIEAEEEKLDKVFAAFRELIYEGGLNVPITSIDLTDFNNIIVVFDDRIEFDMGNWSEIEYKISFAEHIITRPDMPADKEGYLTMVGTNQCSFRNRADVEATHKQTEEATSSAVIVKPAATEPASAEQMPAETDTTELQPTDVQETADTTLPSE